MMEEPLPSTDPNEEEEESGRNPGLVTTAIMLLLVLAMLASLVWPLLRIHTRRRPTPTPPLLREAQAVELPVEKRQL